MATAFSVFEKMKFSRDLVFCYCCAWCQCGEGVRRCRKTDEL